MSDRDRPAANARRLLCPTEAFMLVPPAETTLRCAAAKREIELPCEELSSRSARACQV